VHIRTGEDGDIRGDAEVREEIGEEPHGSEDKGRQREAEVDAVDQRVKAVLGAAGAEGLGNQGVEADEEAFAKEREDEEEAGADADGGDGLGAVGEAADHHGVHDGHADPADFGEDQGQCQVECGAEFGA
jgi:hypothetical protein